MTESLHQADKLHILQELMTKAFARTKKSYAFQPQKIYTLPNCIAIIDSIPSITQVAANYGPSWI